MRKLLLLRPQPGLSASAERARQMGLEVIECPLFRVEALAWQAPDPASYDALLLTSANAIRHGGSQLEAIKTLPVHAIGAATADAARAAGFRLLSVGDGDAADLLAGLPHSLRMLHLAGEDYRQIDGSQRVDRRLVYRSAPIEQPGLPALAGLVAAIHSPRAGARLAELADERDRTAIAAISDAAAQEVESGWERVEIAERPNDSSLLALAAMLCHTSPPE